MITKAKTGLRRDLSEEKLSIIRFQTMLRVRRYRARQRIKAAELQLEVVLAEMAEAPENEHWHYRQILNGIDRYIAFQQFDL